MTLTSWCGIAYTLTARILYNNTPKVVYKGEFI